MSIQFNKPRFKLPQLRPHFSKKRIAIFVLIIILIGSYGIKTKMSPLEVQGIVVTPSHFVQTLKEEGIVKPVEEAPIYSKVSGQVLKVYVENGDEVKAGDLLYELDSSELKYQLLGLQGQLLSLEGQQRQANSPPLNAQVLQQQLVIEQAKRNFKDQEDNLSRMKELFENGFIAQVEYDGAVGDWERAKDTLAIEEKALDLIYEQSRPSQGSKEIFQGQRQGLSAQIEQLNQKIQDSKVVAPISGIIKESSLKEGNLVQIGQLSLTLFKQGNYEVLLDALAEDALVIKEGTQAKISIEGNPNKFYNARVTKIAPAAIEKPSPLGLIESRVPITLVLSEEAKELRPGNRVKVEFVIYEENNVLAIPEAAVLSAGEEEEVWLIREGKAELQSVVTGIEDSGITIIEEGLVAGDVLITDPYTEGLTPGKKVKRIE